MSPRNGHDRRAKPMREVGTDATIRQRDRLWAVIILGFGLFNLISVVARQFTADNQCPPTPVVSEVSDAAE